MLNQLLLIQNGEHLSALGSNLARLSLSHEHSDAVLHLGGGRQLRAHRAVLAAASQYLGDVLKAADAGAGGSGDDVHLSLPDLDHDAVKIIVDFAYKGEAK